MGKTIAIIGKISNPKVKEFICQEVNEFFGINYEFDKITTRTNAYVKPFEDKITSEQTNNYIDELAHTTLNSKQKFGLIENFELLSVANQNKLLKTFEDNKDNTLQIIVVSDANKMIRTIRSRMLILDFRNETLEYNCLDSERPFYEQIIKNQTELDYIKENEDYARTLMKIFELAKREQFDQVYILYTTRFSQFDKTLNRLIVRILYQALYEQGNLRLLKELFKYEQRLSYNLNEQLQIEALIIEIIKEQKWKK